MVLQGAAGGGILRDYKGSALVAFSTFYGPGTNTFAEARAPLFGLMLCYRLGYSKVAVESEKKEKIRNRDRFRSPRRRGHPAPLCLI